MKKITFLLCAWLLSICMTAQDPELFEPDMWTLHYIIYQGQQTDVVQPSPQDPQYDPGISFEDNTGGQGNAVAFIYFNVFQSSISFDASNDIFTTVDPTLTLGQCEAYCDYEQLYLENFLLRDGLGHTFEYEIVDEGGGNKTLILTDEDGNIAVHGNYVLSISDAQSANITISPNPVDGEIQIFPATATIEQVRIYDQNGREVAGQSVGPNKIDLTLLNSGLYFVEVISEGERIVKKLIKN